MCLGAAFMFRVQRERSRLPLMDPLDWMEAEQLRDFFHRHKTVMSCMENPLTFLCQLRDHNLVPEDTFRKMKRMKGKETMRKALYDVLDRLERKDHIKVFWECVFREPILSKYPDLKILHNSLLNGSSSSYTQLPERVEKEEPVEKQAASVTKKRKPRAKSLCEESQPGPSSPVSQKTKSKKICFSSPIKKGEKNDIWTWPMCKYQLPVTCGGLEGTLHRDKLSKGKKCILSDKQWFTPNEFESLAGMKSKKNWKRSIRCRHASLGKLIKEGHLTAASYKGGKKKQAKESSSSSDDLTTESEGENKKTDEENKDSSSASSSSTPVSVAERDEGGETGGPQPADSRAKQVWSVTCGDAGGKLHSNRFATGTRGKSIRTQTKWLTPTEFVREASAVSDPSWQRDIQWEGKPLGVLLETGTLKKHQVNCLCKLCCPEEEDLENQENDDECCVCKSAEEGEELVVCDYCPCSFHPKCHLPKIEDNILGDEGPWKCTFCIYKDTQKCRYSDELQREVAMSRQISKSMLECQYLLLYLYSHDEMQLFATNPSLLLKDYTKVIETPMWLEKVADKLQRNQYETVGEFVSDVQLIFTNCASYNKRNAEFLDRGSRLKELFDKALQDVFKIL